MHYESSHSLNMLDASGELGLQKLEGKRHEELMEIRNLWIQAMTTKVIFGEKASQ